MMTEAKLESQPWRGRGESRREVSRASLEWEELVRTEWGSMSPGTKCAAWERAEGEGKDHSKGVWAEGQLWDEGGGPPVILGDRCLNSRSSEKPLARGIPEASGKTPTFLKDYSSVENEPVIRTNRNVREQYLDQKKKKNLDKTVTWNCMKNARKYQRHFRYIQKKRDLGTNRSVAWSQWHRKSRVSVSVLPPSSVSRRAILRLKRVKINVASR